MWALLRPRARRIPETEDFALRTYQPKPTEIEREWHLVDADGVVLGRLASEVAQLLRGKHKPVWAPHLDCGDHVVVVNASKVAVTGAKRAEKRYWRHSGFPGGIRNLNLEQMLEKHPERVVELAVRGMLPKSRLGRKMFKKLRVYAGPDHPHVGQNPQPYDLAATRRGASS